MKSFDDFINSKDALFHYTSMQKGIEGILKSKTVKLSVFNKTDDPQEYKNWSISLVGWSLPEDIDKKWSKATIELNNIIKKKSYILCFCNNGELVGKDEDGYSDVKIEQYGYSRSRMWSQYGDHHKGMCFVFSKSLLEDKIGKAFGKEAKYSQISYPFEEKMNYKALVMDGNMLDQSTIEEAVEKHIKKYFDRIYFTKNIDYRDESEYRIVLIDENESKEYKEFEYGSSLKGIIVGERFPDVYLPSVKALSVKRSLRKIYWHNGSFIPLEIKNKKRITPASTL